jgi:hypothetical protein
MNCMMSISPYNYMPCNSTWMCLMSAILMSICQKKYTVIFKKCHQLIAMNFYSFPHWIESEISKEDSETNCSPVPCSCTLTKTWQICAERIFVDWTLLHNYSTYIEWYKYFSNIMYFLVKSTPFWPQTPERS